MSAARIEQLVLELLDVGRLQHASAGEVPRPATAVRKSNVWQAKGYGDGINPEECQKSGRQRCHAVEAVEGHLLRQEQLVPAASGPPSARSPRPATSTYADPGRG
jgi:hypothetical protein